MTTCNFAATCWNISTCPGFTTCQGTVTCAPQATCAGIPTCGGYMTCIAIPQCSPTQCHCPCLGDPACDSTICDILDVVNTVGVAFRNVPAVFDGTCIQGNPAERTDLDCSGATDVVDVVKVVAVAFRNANPATEFCDPCNCNPYPTNCP